MTKPIPTIQKYMTTTPLTVGKDQSIETASRLMSDARARHLPVLDGGHLIGIVSERDLAMVQNIVGPSADQRTVEDAMSFNPYCVAPDAPLDQVAEEMASHRYGSAVVVQNEKVVGIFTAVDGLTALAELLRTRLSH